MNEDIKIIAEQLEQVVLRETIRRTTNDSTYQENFEFLSYDLKELIRKAKVLAEDFKDQGLTFNSVEAEGYLRAMLTVDEILKEYEIEK